MITATPPHAKQKMYIPAEKLLSGAALCCIIISKHRYDAQIPTPKGRNSMKLHKTALSAAIAAITAALMLIGTILPATAAAAYKPREGYAASKYYAALKNYALTGDERGDTVAIALTQLGYHEGNSEADFDGMNTSGDRNFVEYNRLYGKVDNNEGNGVSYGYAWCAAFVSFCLRMANVDENAAVSEISCSRMVSWYRAVKGRAAWQERSYTPRTGDVIFFKTGTSSSVSTHVGLVVGTKDGDIYTVEGNSGGVVGMHRYAHDDKTIVGYGIPDYAGTSRDSYDFKLEADNERLGFYRTTASDGLNFRSQPGTSGQKLTDPLPYWTQVEITEIKNGWGRTVYGGKTGWISMSYTINENDIVYSVYYKTSKGKAPLPQRKMPGESITITAEVPKADGYVFVGWVDASISSDVAYIPGDTYAADATTELTAKFEREEYSVLFKNDDGSLISSGTYYFGDKVKIPPTPQKESDGKYSYTFEGWDRDVSAYVAANAVYTAKYTKTALPDTTAGTESRGCGAAFSASAAVIVLIFGAAILKKQKN